MKAKGGVKRCLDMLRDGWRTVVIRCRPAKRAGKIRAILGLRDPNNPWEWKP